LRDKGVDGRIIIKWFLKEIVYEGVNWIQLAKDGACWRTSVNTAIDVLVTWKIGEFLE
jgi:hypothetical protein